MSARRVLCRMVLILTVSAPVLAAPLPLRIDPDTGAETREIQAHGVSLSLTQILPDQVRAFYLSRGFDAASANRYATSCVFMTVLRNDAAPAEVSYRLVDWQFESNGVVGRAPPLNDWLALWQKNGVSAAARIAFRWAQFPSEQDYARGEWNQGMLALGLPPGQSFDLVARWSTAGQHHEARLNNVRCAE